MQRSHISEYQQGLISIEELISFMLPKLGDLWLKDILALHLKGDSYKKACTLITKMQAERSMQKVLMK